MSLCKSHMMRCLASNVSGQVSWNLSLLPVAALCFLASCLLEVPCSPAFPEKRETMTRSTRAKPTPVGMQLQICSDTDRGSIVGY
ncbi:unnamed protein product [Urochloa humidicola]